VKFSVLLPTRNRLALLRYAVETVTRQDYPDWEIVVSDNHSEEDIAGFVKNLQDPRVRYFRTEGFIPVTENWNRAIEHSTGDYIIMLGDDDGLTRGYFRRIRELLLRFDRPEVIYSNAYLFAYPGVMPGHPEGCLCVATPPALRNITEPFLLERGTALHWVRQSMNLNSRIAFNMQYALFSRELFQKIRGKFPFFQSPYPDYYAMNALFLEAGRILMCPDPLVIVGISPKSFGYFYFNRQETRGIDFLKNLTEKDQIERLRDTLLPGTAMNDCFLIAMEALSTNYGKEFGLWANRKRYRYLQALYVFANYYLERNLQKNDVDALWRRLRFAERCTYGLFLPLVLTLARIAPSRRAKRLREIFLRITNKIPVLDRNVADHRLNNLLEAFEET